MFLAIPRLAVLAEVKILGSELQEMLATAVSP